MAHSPPIDLNLSLAGKLIVNFDVVISHPFLLLQIAELLQSNILFDTLFV